MSKQEVYLNGRFVPYEEATVHVEDRGLLFADGIYEVVRAYGGRIFALNDHMERLARSADEMRLPLPAPLADLKQAVLDTLARSRLDEATVYIQITRGGGVPRAHGFPENPQPTVFMIARPAPARPARLLEEGATMITVPDRRWHMCHIKSTGLFLNALAKQEAQEKGADDALFIRGEVVTETSMANFAAVWSGAVHTHPEGPWILSGITRRWVLRLASEAGIPVVEEPFTLAELFQAEEAFVSGTNSEVTPVVRVDGRAIGDGRPGPLTRRLAALYAERARSAN